MQTLSERLKFLFENNPKFTQAALARACGIKQPSISDWFSGRTKRITGQNLLKAAEYLGVTPEWLASGKGRMERTKNDREVTGNDLEIHHEGNIKLRYINISGEILGGSNGYLNMQQFPAGYAAGCVAHPVSGNRCYALKVRGDSMSPRIRHGEIVIVDPDKAPESGEDVVVSLRDGRMMIKVFLYRKGNEITLGSINAGHGNITVTQDEIYDMHYVAARLPGGATCNMPE